MKQCTEVEPDVHHLGDQFCLVYISTDSDLCFSRVPGDHVDS